MNAERFTFYIKNPAHLYQITYTELKSLVLQYPYCQNLRYLLLKKSILENHKELDQNLQLAATFSTDRDFLYRQIKDGESYVSEADSFLLKEDYLELKELGSDSVTDSITEIPVPVSAEVSKNVETKIEADEPSIDLSEPTEEEDTAIVNPDLEQESISPQAILKEEDLSGIDEEEFEDITEEIDDIFEEPAETETSEPLVFGSIPEEVEGPQEQESEEISKSDNQDDDAISIEELIALDNMTPLERMEKIRMQKDVEKEHTEKTNTNEDQLDDLKKKTFDFSELDELIEQTKKEVQLEITNDDFLEVTAAEKVNKPSPKTTFGSWLKQFQTNEQSTDQEEEFEISEEKKASKAKKKKKKKKITAKAKKEGKAKNAKGKKKNKPSKDSASGSKPKQIAEDSLKESEGIVSETLALLLVKQENYKKAIKMYEKLILIFPEKSSFFAEQIKKLKNL